MWQWLTSFVNKQALVRPSDDIPAFVDRSALADFVRLLQEADYEELVMDAQSGGDPT